MDDAGAVLGGDVVGVEDEVRVLDLDQVERAAVGPALHLGAGERRAGGLPALAEGLGQQRLGDDQPLVAVGGHDVGDVRVDGGGGVGDQGPRGGRPDQQRGLARERAAGQREADEDRGVDHGLVALGQLVVGQAGAAARAPGGDAVVLDQQALVEDLLERPPDGLDVRRVHRPVGLVEVDPVPHAGGQLGEGVGVAGHRLAALGVELGDAVRLDVLLAGEAELLLDGQLDREAVTVPAGLAGDVVALHRPVAGEDVLEDAGLDVVGAGHAVGGRRALVEDPLGAALGLLQAALEDLVVLPERQDPVLQGRQVDLRGNGAIEGDRAKCVLRRAVVGGGLGAHRGRLPPADAWTGSDGGTRRHAAPRYHPPWPRCCLRPSCLGLLPGLVGRGVLPRPFFRRLRGDLPAVHAPGLAPSPGRWWLRTSVLVPSAPCRPSVSAAASRFCPSLRLSPERRPGGG